MRTAKELCELGILSDDDLNFDYGTFLGEFGEIIIHVDRGDYQGDSLLIYKNDNGQFGYLCFGWGSCSGCDALQACDGVEDLQELMDHLYNSIIWFDSKESLSTFIKEHNWNGDYFGEESTERFISSVREFLNET